MNHVIVLQLGCGAKQDLSTFRAILDADGLAPDRAIHFVNLDADANVHPDLVCRLGSDVIELPTNSVDHVLAFHVLEHIGTIGHVEEWFHFWAELYRVMRPGGHVLFECPYYTSIWAWADPTHVRAISEYTFLYLNQDAYRMRHHGSAIPDYRPLCDFPMLDFQLLADTRESISTIRGRLVARKPLRVHWVDSAITVDIRDLTRCGPN